MKKLLPLFLCLILSAGVFAAPVDEFNGFLGDFLEEINAAMPDNAMLGGNWSDSYIGQFLSVPPHFGVGVSGGVTRFPIAALEKAVAMVGPDLPGTIVMPTASLEGRLGGFVLPFDIGARIGFMPKVTLKDVEVNLLSFGGDVRFALLKSGVIKPDISLGLGYSHISGSVGYAFNAGNLGTKIPGITVTGDTKDLGINFKSNVFELKAQISKSFLAITPYVGASGYYAISESDYSVGDQEDSKKENVYGGRVFGGLSLNITVVKIDLSGMYNFTTQNWGANVGVRIQI